MSAVGPRPVPRRILALDTATTVAAVALGEASSSHSQTMRSDCDLPR